jgi:hypothetical protein
MSVKSTGALAEMAARYERPDWVRRLNLMGESVGGAERLVPLDADELLELGTASLGAGKYSNLGDPEWRNRFRALTDCLAGFDFHVVGRLITRQELLRALRTRLLLSRAFDADPDIEKEKVEAPIIVTGPARSGTTILYELLWLDPGLRAPLAGEALHPIPFTDAETAGDDRRVSMAECEQELWADVQPEFAAIHELRSDLPVECVTLTEPSFCGPHWGMISPGPVPLDPPTDYAFHRRILQALQRGRERRSWLLKTPAHLALLPLVFQTYPDAWIVQTHRDPARTMPSTVSTVAMIHWLRTEQVDVAGIVASIEAAFGAALNAVAEQRKAHALPDRFVDVHFQSLLADPVGSVEQAYRRMQREFTPEHAERIRAYLAEKPRGKFGVHKYRAVEWGFDAEALRGRLSPYIDHFGVTLEKDA